LTRQIRSQKYATGRSIFDRKIDDKNMQALILLSSVFLSVVLDGVDSDQENRWNPLPTERRNWRALRASLAF